jgi:hypothetical protein
MTKATLRDTGVGIDAADPRLITLTRQRRHPPDHSVR